MAFDVCPLRVYESGNFGNLMIPISYIAVDFAAAVMGLNALVRAAMPRPAQTAPAECERIMFEVPNPSGLRIDKLGSEYSYGWRLM